jgi:large subunit ribosomal protein L7Ae
VQPKKDMTRYVKWPEYVRLQRQKKILKERLKVPPALAQFTNVVDKNTATSLFKLLNKYRPETSQEKKARLVKEAEIIAKDESKKNAKIGEKPMFVKKGLNHCVGLIENKKAQLVVIAHDVDPIELVVYLPHLCQKRGIPYCIVKGIIYHVEQGGTDVAGKSRLGTVVHQKTAAILTFTDVRPEDKNALATLSATIKVTPTSKPRLTFRPIIMTNFFRNMHVTGVEVNLGRRAWMPRQERQRLLRWPSKFK